MTRSVVCGCVYSRPWAAAMQTDLHPLMRPNPVHPKAAGVTHPSDAARIAPLVSASEVPSGDDSCAVRSKPQLLAPPLVKAFLHERGADSREGIATGFTHVGGVPRTVLGDNARPLVRARDHATGTVSQ